jgi:hypothetical protein
MRTRNHVHAHEFADTLRGAGARFGRGFHRRDVATNDGRNVSAAVTFLVYDEVNLRGFDHGV